MCKTITVNDMLKLMEQLAPKSLAYDWDNVGLQVGSVNKKIRKVMVTLDVLENVVDEAVDKEVDLIIAHHPLLFKPLKQLNIETPIGRIVSKLIKHDITVYASHTNLDIADGGVNDMLAEKLQLKSTKVLVESGSKQLFKLAVYVPESHAEVLAEALGAADAGHIGNYSHCMYRTNGEGTFKPLKGTNPYIGSQGQLEKVKEVKIETIITEEQKQSVLKALFATHPYEEPAYDIYPLDNKGDSFGLGRIGSLAKEMTLRELCEHVKKSLEVPALRVIGDLDRVVSTAAVVGGSGKGFINQARSKGADVYITGDMTFHDAQEAEQLGLTVIDPGHHVEKVMKKGVKDYLEKHLSGTDNVDIIVSNERTEPFQFL